MSSQLTRQNRKISFTLHRDLSIADIANKIKHISKGNEILLIQKRRIFFMATFKCHIELQQHTRKPIGTEITNISFTQSRDYSLDIIAKCIEQGQTIIPAALQSESMIVKLAGAKLESQQLFLVDIDSDVKAEFKALPMDDMVTRFKQYGINPSFTYHSFSHIEKYPKYRLAFAIDKAVTSEFERMLILRSLFEIAGKQSGRYFADTNCTNVNRLFFGTCHKVQWIDETAINNINSILVAVENIMKDKGREHRTTSRLFKAFYSKVGLVYDKKIGLVDAYTNYQNMHASPNCKDILYQFGDACNSYQLNIPLHKVSEVCHLMRLFEEGIDFDEPDRKVLMSNLLCLRGGEKFYIDTVNAKYLHQYVHKRTPEKEVAYWKKKKYAPKSCIHCTYYDECQPQGTNISSSIMRRNGAKIIPPKSIHTNSLDETRAKMADIFHNKLVPGKINVIKVDTGGGKTYFLQRLSNIAICTPNHKKALEIYNDRKQLGLDSILIPDLSKHLTPKMKALYAIGAVNEANLEIRLEASKAYKKWGMRSESGKAFIHYLETLERMKNEETVVIMTIQRAVNTTNFFGRKVVFDESPLDELLEMKTLSKQAVLDALDKEMLPSEMHQQIMKLKFQIEANDKNTGFSLIKAENDAIKKELSKYAQHLVEIGCTNLFHMLNAHTLYYNDDKIVCYRKRTLPPDCTIFSATLPEEIAKLVLGDIIHHDLGNIEIKGELLQYSPETYSRACLKNNTDILPDIVKKHLDCNFITFKKYEEQLWEMGIDDNKTMHFGALEGLNTFGGQDLVVIGTPYINPDAVKNYARAIGYECTIEKAMLRNVEFNGYKFRLTTFDNEVLRAIHLHLIWEQLQQAVGRARLVNHDCTVHVYAEVPVIGAKLAS